MQRRLNPNIKEVVKGEIIKWINADIIYFISNSSWVSPMQVVLEKSRWTVTKTKKGEVPTKLSIR